MSVCFACRPDWFYRLGRRRRWWRSGRLGLVSGETVGAVKGWVARVIALAISQNELANLRCVGRNKFRSASTNASGSDFRYLKF